MIIQPHKEEPPNSRVLQIQQDPVTLCFHDFCIFAAAKSLQSCPTLCNPIRQQPTRLPRPWDSPGKNIGVGCHFLLQCMKVKSESEVTLSDPVDCSLPGSSIHGIFQARVLEWGATAFSVCIFTLTIFFLFHRTQCKLVSFPCNQNLDQMSHHIRNFMLLLINPFPPSKNKTT